MTQSVPNWQPTRSQWNYFSSEAASADDSIQVHVFSFVLDDFELDGDPQSLDSFLVKVYTDLDFEA